MVEQDITIFQKYLKELRNEKGITLESLCKGLCTPRAAAYLEEAGREIGLLMQDALLERLGVSSDTTQCYVDYKEYDSWELRQRILHNITFENMERAEELLECYRQTIKSTDHLAKQFYLSQLAQIHREKGAGDAELYGLFEQALALTVPSKEEHFEELALSLKELNLMLEKEQYRSGGPRTDYLGRIVAYVENKKWDRIGMSKIYSKAVCFWCKAALKDEEFLKQPDAITILLNRCDKVFEELRGAFKLYFMWEVLCLQAELTERRIAELDESVAGGDKSLAENEKLGAREYRERIYLKLCKKENAEWRWALESVYADYGVRKETWEYCYLYVNRDVFCTNDVIRIRRKMFGFAPKEMREGICEGRTYRYIEQRKSNPRRYITENLFARVNMSVEMFRTEVVSGDMELKQLVEEVNREMNALRIERVEALLRKIENKVPADIKVNQQVLMRKQIMLMWRKGEMEDDEFRKYMREILNLTLPLEAFLSEGEKFLTNAEQSCIQNLMQGMDKKSEEFKICVKRFEEYYAEINDKELQDAVIGMYEHIMDYVGSELGNRGEFDKSDSYNQQIAEGSLRFRRMIALPNGIYGLWWNHDQRKEKGIPVAKELDGEEELTKCILFSKMANQDQRTAFYQDELDKLRAKK